MAEVVASAARLPTPEPVEPSRASTGKRKRTSESWSPSPRRRRPSPPRRRESFDRPLPMRDGRDDSRHDGYRDERPQKQEKKLPTAEEKAEIAKKEYNDLLAKKSGGVYIPPAKLRELQKNITDPKSKEYQRMMWEALKKSINGMVNKVNIGNIKDIVPELFHENLIRGQGVFCRSVMKAQALFDEITDVLACMVAIVNSKIPLIGRLLINRLVWQWQRAYKHNDKAVCISSSSFLAQLTNFEVVETAVIVQVLLTLTSKPTDDGMEIAVRVYEKVGRFMEENDPQLANVIMNDLRKILQSRGDLAVRTQYALESLFLKRRSGFKDYPIRREELDLIADEDVVTHKEVSITDKIDPQNKLNVFQFDEDWEEHEKEWQKLRDEILGLDNDDGDDDEDAESDVEMAEESEDEEERKIEIKDQTSQDLINLRRTIYLTIKSSGTFEEAVHKLMRINLPQGREKELPEMIIECAAQERTYNTFYGNIAERFSKLNSLWRYLNEELFEQYYNNIHQHDSNKIRIIANVFAHLLDTDAISWKVFQCVHMNEDETTASSRIFIKILLEELWANIGLKEMVAKFQEPELAPFVKDMFPTDDPKRTRFAINYYTALKMGELTDGMRVWLEDLTKKLKERQSTPESEDDTESLSRYALPGIRLSIEEPPWLGLDPIVYEDPLIIYRDSDGKYKYLHDNSDASRSRSYDSDSGSYDSRDGDSRRGRRIRDDRDSRSPSPARRREESPMPPRKRDFAERRVPAEGRLRSRSPEPRSERKGSSSPPPRRTRRESSSPPPRRARRASSSPPPRNRRASSSPPPRRRRESSSPPPRRNRRDSSSPPPRVRRRESSSPPPRRSDRYRIPPEVDRYRDRPEPIRRRRYSSDEDSRRGGRARRYYSEDSRRERVSSRDSSVYDSTVDDHRRNAIGGWGGRERRDSSSVDSRRGAGRGSGGRRRNSSSVDGGRGGGRGGGRRDDGDDERRGGGFGRGGRGGGRGGYGGRGRGRRNSSSEVDERPGGGRGRGRGGRRNGGD